MAEQRYCRFQDKCRTSLVIHPSAHLAPWQIAVAALAGPLLPTFLGYLSFALWCCPPGSRHRAQHLWGGIAWSLLTLMLLFPQALMVPMLLMGVTEDRDYSLMVQNMGSFLWLAKLALAVTALANLLMGGRLVKDLVLGLRRARTANKNGAANRSQPVGPELNRTPPAAGSGG